MTQLLGQFQESQASRLQCRSVAQTDFVAVAAARGCGRVAGGCLRYGNWLVRVTMMCSAGRWLSGIALQIGCAELDDFETSNDTRGCLVVTRALFAC